MSLKLQIVIGSTRPTRAADKVAPWVIDRAVAQGGFDVEVLDLRDWPLPVFGEHAGSIGDFSDPTYSDPIVRRWNKKVKEADAYLFITPEYNHSVPAVLKNAIDNVFVSFAFRNKPFLAVGYSGAVAGGVRAIEHLVQIGVEVELVALRASVVIPFVNDAFDDAGEPVDREVDIRLSVALEDLAWWATALQRARAEGELPPATVRIRAALAALRVNEEVG